MNNNYSFVFHGSSGLSAYFVLPPIIELLLPVFLSQAESVCFPNLLFPSTTLVVVEHSVSIEGKLWVRQDWKNESIPDGHHHGTDSQRGEQNN